LAGSSLRKAATTFFQHPLGGQGDDFGHEHPLPDGGAVALSSHAMKSRGGKAAWARLFDAQGIRLFDVDCGEKDAGSPMAELKKGKPWGLAEPKVTIR
jgi:hypothetical protein